MKSSIKKLITVIICLAITVFVYLYQDVIVKNVFSIINSFKAPSYVETNNLYAKGTNYKYVQITDTFEPYNYQDLLNIIYTTFDNRFASVRFYCPSEYEECLSDVEKIANENNEEILTIIGNLVSPYNKFSDMNVSYSTTGEVTLNISYKYDDDDIEYVNAEIDKVFSEYINDSMTDEQKIRTLHDYLVGNVEYDTQFEEELNTNKKTTYDSDTAVGLFKNKLAICSGYADTMALFLDKLGIANFKVASNTHIWNVIKSTNGYLHIDVTWDDPIGGIGNIIYDDYLLITSEELLEKDPETHSFDTTVYMELAK